MKYDEAKLYLEHTSYDDFKLEGWQIENRLEAIKVILKENERLKKQLNYLKSGEYYNQLKFENEMLQQVVDTNGVPSEVYDYIDCTHRNTELLEENNKLSELWCDSRAKIRYLETQQKEFIKYLEKCIKKLEKPSMNKLQNTINLGISDVAKEILSKYKEIIGGENENK